MLFLERKKQQIDQDYGKIKKVKSCLFPIALSFSVVLVFSAFSAAAEGKGCLSAELEKLVASAHQPGVAVATAANTGTHGPAAIVQAENEIRKDLGRLSKREEWLVRYFKENALKGCIP